MELTAWYSSSREDTSHRIACFRAALKQVTLSIDRTAVVIIGGGPAGLAPLLAAHRSGRLAELLEQGVTVVEQSAAVGEGSIGHWSINSDSTGFTFADCLAGPPGGELAPLRSHPLTKEFLEAGDGTVPLRRAGEFLALVGQAMNEVIAARPNSRVLKRCQALSTRRTAGGWLTRVKDADSGQERTIHSRNVVLATGASQPAERLRAEIVAGANLVERWGEKLLQSSDVLTVSGFAAISARLAALGRSPRVVIIGGSTSAAAVAYALLNRMPGVPFGPNAVTIAHRRPLRIFYPSVDAALADGYTEFGPDDICPVSGRVFRLAGFRLDSRELIMRARGIGGRPPEPRLQLHRLGIHDAASRSLLDNADLVIAALGYRPRALPVFDQADHLVPLLAQTSPQAPLVDGSCRVLDALSNPLPGLFAIGLAAGFVPHGKLGGEPSFRGQANGLWLWQSDVGGLIVDAILDSSPVPMLDSSVGHDNKPLPIKIPLVRPAPAKLSLAIPELQALEESGMFSNFGPVNTRFEQEMLTRFFAGEGACTTVCNATLGLMLAIKDAVGDPPPGRFALMPGFTFAAAAHAALWCGLTPLLCDIHPAHWAADMEAESALLARYAGKIAIVMPYATFGYPIDLEPYTKLSNQLGVPVVVDAAASLGTFDASGRGFASGFDGSVVFSMHATKSFAVGEAGLIYSANPDRIARIRAMSNFGFGEPRIATMPGLNAKLSEVNALQGLLQLARYDGIVARRAALHDHYRQALPELEFQLKAPGMQAHQFVPVLLPPGMGGSRDAIRAELADHGIITGHYFSPYLLEQPYFRKVCAGGPVPVCDDVSARILSLPLFDTMTNDEVEEVSDCLRCAIGVAQQRNNIRRPSRSALDSKLVYGPVGPESRR
jgi:dTDP-4-amino-4,6-dideoxygalactose transaminase